MILSLSVFGNRIWMVDSRIETGSSAAFQVLRFYSIYLLKEKRRLFCDLQWIELRWFKDKPMTYLETSMHFLKGFSLRPPCSFLLIFYSIWFDFDFVFFSFGRRGVRASTRALYGRDEAEYRRLRRSADPHFRFADEYERFPIEKKNQMNCFFLNT